MLSVDIRKSVGDFNLDVCFEIENEKLALLGASGSGKSMCLKCIAGIEKPDSGRIVLNDRVLFDSEKRINLSPQKRKVGYLFQQYALFPNMTVRQNIEAALHKLSRNERDAIVNGVLSSFDLEAVAGHKPHQLSGGQQQKTALARIMVTRPELLMLDEPFSALDSYNKLKIEMELFERLTAFEGDIVYVTHDMEETIRFTDKTCILDNGYSEKVKAVKDAMNTPETVTAAKLFGINNITRIHFVNEAEVYCEDYGISLTLSKPITGGTSGINYLGIAEKDIRIVGEENIQDKSNVICCRLMGILKSISENKALLKVKNNLDKESIICAIMEENYFPNAGEDVYIEIKTDKAYMLKGTI